MGLGSRVEDQQEGAGQERVQQSHRPLQVGLLLSDIVPHLNAHVLPGCAEAQQCSLLLLLGREWAHSLPRPLGDTLLSPRSPGDLTCSPASVTVLLPRTHAS